MILILVILAGAIFGLFIRAILKSSPRNDVSPIEPEEEETMETLIQKWATNAASMRKFVDENISDETLEVCTAEMVRLMDYLAYLEEHQQRENPSLEARVAALEACRDDSLGEPSRIGNNGCETAIR